MESKSSSARNSKMATQGFLLIEIGVALIFFGGVVSALFHFYCKAVDRHHQSRHYLQATRIANTILESIIFNGKMPESQSFEQEDFSVLVQSQNVDNALPHYKTVQVDVAWESIAGQKHMLTLESGCIMASKEGRDD